MKSVIFIFLIILPIFSSLTLSKENTEEPTTYTHLSDYSFYKIASRLDNLNLGLHRYNSQVQNPKGTILLIHGSSFPSKLSFAFKMGGESWVDNLTSAGFTVYSLDLLGYGSSDRYPDMIEKNKNAKPLGRGIEVTSDLNLAVNFILDKEKINNINLLGHSWGGAVAAKYAEAHPKNVKSLIIYAGITSVQPTKIQTPTKIFAYSELTPEDRIKSLNSLAPLSQRPLLAVELFKNWGDEWLMSDSINNGNMTVMYPAGPKSDVQDFLNGYSFYDPAKITTKVLVIRGEYDKFPSQENATQLFNGLINAKSKYYIEIKKGTHVLHLEKNRHKLYKSILKFLLKA